MPFSGNSGIVSFGLAPLPSPPPPVGRISGFLGLGSTFRDKFVQLVKLGYALRIKLPLFIAFGFFVSHLIINYVPRVELEINEEEEDDEEEIEEEEGTEQAGTQVNMVQ